MSVLKKSKNFDVVACCDKDRKRLLDFSKKFGIKYSYTSIKRMISQKKIDLLLICSPTRFHHAHSKLALNSKTIKAVICEKPFGFNYKKAKDLISVFKKKNKFFIISYQRRWDNFYERIRKIIKVQKIGKLISVVAQVDRALYQNSSHMIDLIVSFCGSAKIVNGFLDKTFPPRIVHGFNDYGAYIFIRHKNNIVSFIKASTDETSKKYFELELNFTNGRIVIDNDNERFRLYKFRESTFFKKYKQLYLSSNYNNNFKFDRMERMYKFIYKKINSKNTNMPFNIYELIEPLKIINCLRKN